MDALILYGSRYGSARRYAEALSQKAASPPCPLTAQKSLRAFIPWCTSAACTPAVCWASKKALRSLRTDGNFRLLLATVGVCDPALPENLENIRASLQKQLPARALGAHKAFSPARRTGLRSAFDGHRAALTLLKRSLERTPRERWSAEDREFFETYGKKR